MREILTTAADDEARHYEWAESQLEAVGVSADSGVGRVSRVVEQAQARLADSAEAIERGGRRGIEAARRGASALRERLPERPSDRALAVGAVALGIGFLVTTALWLSRRDRS